MNDIRSENIIEDLRLMLENMRANKNDAELKRILETIKDKDFSFIGCGEAEGKDRAMKAVVQAVENPLLNKHRGIKGAESIVMIVSGLYNFNDQNAAGGYIEGLINKNTSLIFFNNLNDHLADRMRVVIIGF